MRDGPLIFVLLPSGTHYLKSCKIVIDREVRSIIQLSRNQNKYIRDNMYSFFTHISQIQDK